MRPFILIPMTIPPKETLTCLLPTALDARLAQRAVRDATTKSEIVVAALEAYLEPETALERSLKRLETRLFDRLLGIELRLGRIENLGHIRLEPGVESASDSVKTGLPLVPIAVNPDDEDCYDEPDEVLSDFAIFATNQPLPLSSPS